ncbi:hypothetical protein MNBD_GAMMA16-705 [hydrothermal vent metagenome]|uniref:Curli production assembly/transport component CsgG n=1 Tax=hydrothermal vent metagenome TaxID=652676 RepID=A0A3B0ZA41_9ZZZZ
MNKKIIKRWLERKKKIGVLLFLPVFLLLGCATNVSKKEALPVTTSTHTDQGQFSYLAADISKNFNQQKKSRMAVVEFSTLAGKNTRLGVYIAETLTTELFNTGRFDVMERRLVNKIIEEQELSMTGMISDETAVELGAQLGVNAITTGTITDLGNSYEINARVIDAESGAVNSAANIRIAKTATLEKLNSKISRRPGDASRPSEDGKFIKQWATTLHGFSSQYDRAGWSAKQVLGEPNVFGCGDLRGAWTTESGGSQYVEVGFKDAVVPKRVIIKENNGVGFVSKLVVYSEDGREQEIEVHDDLRDCPGELVVSLETIQFQTKRLRVYADMDRTDEYENIDAISLEGFAVVE